MCWPLRHIFWFSWTRHFPELPLGELDQLHFGFHSSAFCVYWTWPWRVLIFNFLFTNPWLHIWYPSSRCRYSHRNNVNEFTIRSIMGDYSGFAGLFEIERLKNEDGSHAFRYHLGGCSFVRLQLLTVLQVLWIVWFVILGFTFLFLWAECRMFMTQYISPRVSMLQTSHLWSCILYCLQEKPVSSSYCSTLRGA